MFLHMSVCHSVHREVPAPVHAGIHLPLGRYTPWAVTPPGRYTPWDTVNKQMVRILLECNLVYEIHLIYFS